MRFRDFNLSDLYAALDAQRQTRGLSWSQVAREINGPRRHMGGHALSASTITGTRFRRVAEADGILQMLRWLHRQPESFIPGHSLLADMPVSFPEVGPRQVWRFDTRKVYAALNAQRSERNLTWAQVGKELGLSASSLAYLAKGGRTSFPGVMRMTGWLKQPALEFTQVVGEPQGQRSNKASYG